jgi:hypothetical protein
MKLLARVEAFSQLGKYPVVLMRFLFDDGVIRTEERIQLRTPDGRVIDTRSWANSTCEVPALGSERPIPSEY